MVIAGACVNVLLSTLLAGFAAGAVGDYIAESTILEEWRHDILEKYGEDADIFQLISCRYCVSAWAAILFAPLAYYGALAPNELVLAALSIPAAWKVATILRGIY